MLRSFKLEGIILKRRNFGEADRILTIFTQNLGKIKVKAPGVRRILSRRSPHIEPLNLSMLTLYKSSSASFPILTEAAPLERFSFIKKDLKLIGFAYYLCELVSSLCPQNQENRDVFFLLKNTLFQLSKGNNSSTLVSYFEKELLRSLGFWREAELLKDQDSKEVIENLLERKLNTLRILPLFTSY